MADYFERVSFTVNLPHGAAGEVRALYARLAAAVSDEDGSVEWPAALAAWASAESSSAVLGLRMEADGDTLWITDDDGSPSLEFVADFLQYVLRTHDPTGHVVFEWSNDCSKPAEGAFGGGACLVTVDEIVFRSTSRVADELREAWLTKSRGPAPPS